MKTFREILDLARENDIWAGRLFIAEEVYTRLGKSNEQFEEICDLLYNIYIDSDLNDLHAIVEAYFKLKEKGERTSEENIIDLACCY